MPENGNGSKRRDGFREHWEKLVFGLIAAVIIFMATHIWDQSQTFAVQIEITKQNSEAIKENQKAIRMLQTEAAEQRGGLKATLDSIDKRLQQIERRVDR